MISLRRIVKTYRSPAGEVSILRDIDLTVAKGQLVTLIGKSGSGKSTLLHLVGGIDRPTAGSVVVNGTALESLGEARLASWRGHTVGFVFQFFQLLPTLTVLENVMLPMDFAGAIPVGQRRARAMSLLSRVGVAAHAGKLPSALSGGEQQRVAIARALANDPRVVLADEPTGNLDAETGHRVIENLFRLNAALGTALVLVTHDTELAGRTRRPIRLKAGRVVDVSGTPA